MSAQFLIILCLITLAQNFTKGEEKEQKSIEATQSTLEEMYEAAQSNPAIDRSSHHHHHYESPVFQGFWKKKFIWRPRWVKTWQEKKIYVAVWKRMWGPAEVKEWVPVPKPPPGWVRHDNHVGGYFVKVGVPH